MAPKSTTAVEESIPPRKDENPVYKLKIIWHNVFLLAALHALFPYSLYVGLTRGRLISWLFVYVYLVITALGITAGGHRLWCHRSYKAKLPLRIFLAICHGMAAQTDLYVWCRDHRVHHKFSETDADPHNIKRGFFFAHCGWLMCKKHPEVTAKGKGVNTDDLLADPVVRFERRFHIALSLFFGFYLPTMIPYWFFDQTLWDCFVCNIGKYVFILNMTWCVNSVAHMYGDRPFDKSIAASECKTLSYFVQGEGWHNYHHAFPWDYSASELGYKLNMSKRFIDFMAKIGQAYDLKTASKELILSKKLKSGDGTRLEDIDEEKKRAIHEDSKNL